jgi:hypothetical protein
MRGAIPPLPNTPSWRCAYLSTGRTLPFSFYYALKSRKKRWVLYVASIKEMNAHKILVGKPERNRSLYRHRHSHKDNIKMYMKKQVARMWPGFI